MNSRSALLKEVLNDLCIQSSTAIPTINEETQLKNLLSKETIENLNLTFAEQILLFEGSQLGRADCTIPPYVEYENLLNDKFNPKENSIRSEIFEWTLSINVSKLLFKSGSLSVTGANFITNADLENKKYRLTDPDKLFDNNDKFSVDLSSRDITIDLQFENCKFYSGINISNSYCENLIFRNCRFGCATNANRPEDTKTYSILSKNTVLRGEFIIEKHGELLSQEIESNQSKGLWEIINSNVDFSFARIDGQLRIEGYNTNRDKLRSVIIKGSLNLYHFIGSSIYLSYSTIELELELSLAKFNSLFADGCIIRSIQAAGIECTNIFIRYEALIREGAMFYKSKIYSDFDCSGSIFNSLHNNNISLSIGGSTIGRVYFSDGFVSLGKILMDNANIEGSVNFYKALIIGEKENKKRTAIYATFLKVKNKVTFNINPAYDQGLENNYYGANRIDQVLRFDNYNDAVNLHLDLNSNKNPVIESMIEAYETKINHFDKHNFHTKILGEANFEHSVIEGTMDCAGCVFKNDTIHNDHNFSNSINLRFAEIKETLFLNSGLEGYNLPFIAEGDIDLQNSSLNNLFISVPSKQYRNKITRLRMIGAKYNYISDDSTNLSDSKWQKKLERLFGTDFYRANWIYYLGNSKKDFFKKRENNFRQPFEQFSSTLFKSGEDNRARDVLVHYRPSANILELLLMNVIIKPIYFFGSRLYLCFTSFILFLWLGKYLFLTMKMENYLISDTTEFNPWLFSFQRLFPFLTVIKSDNYYLSNDVPWYFFIYYVFHSIMGIILLSMLLVNIARMRKGDS